MPEAPAPFYDLSPVVVDAESGVQIVPISHADNKLDVAPTGTSVKRVIFSASLVLMAALSGVADSQLAKQAYAPNFNAPFLMMYCNQLTRLFTYPIFLLSAFGVAHAKHQSFGFKSMFVHGTKVFGPTGLTFRSFLQIIVVLGMVNIVALGLYLSALKFIAPTDSTTILTSQVAIIYIISVIVLKQRLLLFKVFATGLSFLGVAFTAYSNGFNPASLTGVAMALSAAIVYACTSVYMKVMLKTPDFGQVCLYMMSTSIFVILIGWTFPLSMKMTGVENWEFDTAPWLIVFGSGFAALSTALIINYGISATNPFFISMYNLVRIPINNLIDTHVRGLTFSTWDILGAVCISVGFLLIVIPDDRVSVRIRDRLNFALGKQPQLKKSATSESTNTTVPEQDLAEISTVKFDPKAV